MFRHLPWPTRDASVGTLMLSCVARWSRHSHWVIVKGSSVGLKLSPFLHVVWFWYGAARKLLAQSLLRYHTSQSYPPFGLQFTYNNVSSNYRYMDVCICIVRCQNYITPQLKCAEFLIVVTSARLSHSICNAEIARSVACTSPLEAPVVLLPMDAKPILHQCKQSTYYRNSRESVLQCRSFH